MSKKSSGSKKRKKFKENVFKEEEIKYYLTKVKKFAISEDSKALIKSLQQKNNKKKTKNLIPEPPDDESQDDSSVDESPTEELLHEELSNELLDEELLHEETVEKLPTEDILDSELSNDSNVLPENYNFSHPPPNQTPLVNSETVNLQTLEHQKQPDYKSVLVERNPEIDLRRRKLPCCMMEQEIIDAIRNNDIVLITGDTGTGKSTQIPQFLYENGFCMGDSIIGVTQTRRVACIAITKQIALELNANLVGYQIRYDKTFNQNCKIKLMTDGILLNHLKNDIILKKYSVIIIDEAHERRVNSDILIGLLSQIVKLRRQLYNQHNNTLPLKLVIMSATIRKEDFLENEIFKGIKHVHIASGKLNYTVHYNKVTPEDYLLEAKRKILQIHKKLPQGSILAFVTGKHELYKLKSMLSTNSRYGSTKEITPSPAGTTENIDNSIDPMDGEIFELNDESDDLETELAESDDKLVDLEAQSDTVEQEVDERIEYELSVLTENYKKSVDCEWLGSDSQGKLTVKILHASQSNQQQMECFMLPNENERIVILSTNVAETSITLPNIRYVVDSGKEKRKVYDNVRGFEKFEIFNVSKSSADQRAGRCGRLGHGHCYRLYTNSVFDNLFPQSSPVQILESNLTSVCLMLISFGINPYNFTFLTRPPKELIDSAIKTLYHLNTINLMNQGRIEENFNLLGDPFKVPPSQPSNTINSINPINKVDQMDITRLGRCVSLIPLDPRYAKMIYCILAKMNRVKDSKRANFLSVSFTIISAISFNNTLFTHDFVDKTNFNGKFKNDVELLMWLLCEYSVTESKNEFSSLYSINQKLISEVFLQANQIFQVISTQFKPLQRINGLNIVKGKLIQLGGFEMKILLESIIECLIDKVAIGIKYLIPSDKSKGYKCSQMLNETVHLPKQYAKLNYECVVYNYLMKDQTHTNSNNKGNSVSSDKGTDTDNTVYSTKIRMYNILEVNTSDLASVNSSLIISKEIEKRPKPLYSNGVVTAYAKQYYSPLDYPLTIAKIELKGHPLVFRAFAEAFCFGSVYAKLTQFTPLLTCTSEDFYKPLKLNGAMYNFIKLIVNSNVWNKETFEREYTKDNKFLFKQYTNLLKRQYDSRKLINTYQSLL